MNVVISQPMLFPWVGMLEQVRLADIYVHYTDVQFSKGSFVNRVQLKVPEGTRWMTVPLQGHHLGQRIDEVSVREGSDWQAQHVATFEQAYAGTPHLADALALLAEVYGSRAQTIAELSARSLMALCRYFDLVDGRRFVDSPTLRLAGKGSERVADIVQAVGGDVYITGHGAARYLDHSIFERRGIRVEYMNYRRLPYPQLHGPFDPHVSGLDLVANLGRAGRQQICSGTTHWKEFVAS
jgi:hypothetical protein